MTLSYSTDYFIYHEAFDTPQVTSDTHFHEMVEVYYLLEGVACLYANERLYRLMPGDLIILPPNLYHKMWYESDTHSRLLLNVKDTFVPRSVYHKLNTVLYIGKNEDLPRYLDSLFSKIKRTMNTPDEYQEDTLKCLSMDLFLSAVKSSSSILVPFVNNQHVSRAIA